MLIGLTGGIGSGKSTLAAGLHELGYPIYDTDAHAKQIILTNPMVRSQVELLFGSEVLEGNVYHTHLVAKQVFHDPGMLDKLNRIVHPAVAFDVQEWEREEVRCHPQQPFCFVESAILYPSGFDRLCNRIVVVTAPEGIRIQRVVERDHTSVDRVQARIRAQESAIDVHRADLVVHNDGTTPISELCKQIQAFLSTIPTGEQNYV